MQIANSFKVPVPVDQAWGVLLDIERVAPCMPGASLDSVDGSEFTGRVKVKVGPVNLTYKGRAAIRSKDEDSRTAVIAGKGRDARGNGTAEATVTMHLEPDGGETRVELLTDLDITGRPAQLGRSVMTDVGDRIIAQFASALAAELAEPGATVDAVPAAPSTPQTPETQPRPHPVAPRPRTEPEAINLLQLTGKSALRQFANLLRTAIARLCRRSARQH
ncbi:SRPBCC family protein [Kribbella sp. NPDC051936]|uniref:SRPBCC family protein n=1 Tax=Kribbella sp. NPDC051936 TaxID=3154946 RepID=UPI003443E811